MSWIYKGKEFTEDMIHENAIGFIYNMTAIIDGKSISYIGKKNFYADIKTRPAFKELYCRFIRKIHEEFFPNEEYLMVRTNGKN